MCPVRQYFIVALLAAYARAHAATLQAAECRSLYGIHDHNPDPTEYLNHIKPVAGCGWVTATVAVGHNSADTGGANFSALANQGHTVICRINNGYFPSGSIPLAADYDNFARRCSNFVLNSTGCSLWVIGNESNIAGEWAFDGTCYAYVSPQNYAACFRKVYNAIKAVRPNDQVIPQALAPFSGPFGSGTLNGAPHDANPLNWVQYLNQMLIAIAASGPLDGIALHITSRGYTSNAIHSASQVSAGGQQLYFSFYVYKDWVDLGIPPSLYALPLYATECNGYYYWKGGHPEAPTQHYEPGWVQEIYAEINRYNLSAAAVGKPIFHCVNFYRWCASCDGWNIDGADNPYKGQILSDLDAAVAQNYTWPISASHMTLVPTGSVWKYLDNGTDQGTAWRAVNFNDGAWSSGRAQLGYGDGDEATVVNAGPTNNHFITTYFRRSFNVDDTAFFTNLTVRVLRDDGAVVYLNGAEVFRSNMPTNGPILFTTRASSIVPSGDETTNFYAKAISPGLLVSGTNVLAVEIHQVETNSSDISFDLELGGTGNLRPAVSIVSPLNGAVLGGPANVALAADAADADGTVSRVAFFADGLPVGEVVGQPFSLIWSNASEGLHALSAVATDNGGRTATSAPVAIILQTGLVPSGAVWKFLDTGTNLNSAWRSLNFIDSAWASGPAQLGYGDGDEATVIGYGTNANNKYVTTYFRRVFTVADAGSFTNLTLRLLRDDGAVVYVNGFEVLRSNMPTNGAIAHNTLALGAVPAGDETTNFYSANVNPALLVNGSNVLAVEVHQASTNSTDLSFDLELLGARATILGLARADGGLRITWPTSAAGFRLETATNLNRPIPWTTVTNAASVTNGQFILSIAPGAGNTFLRLIRP
ncbi:MAG TPA: Ig-like domain-containing protein [Verrucomicrobiae bacterium]|jgi:hypothetical protein